MSLVQEEKNILNYNDLIDSIKDQKCSVFLGAGLSRNAGYIGWKELLIKLSKLAGEDEDYRKQRVKNPRTWDEWALECKNKIRSDEEGKYRDFLILTYGPNTEAELTSEPYLNIDKIPFTSFITTNYDPCLYNASRHNGEVRVIHTYPSLPSHELNQPKPHQFYIHGIIHPDNPEMYANTIILTSEDYHEAYKQDKQLPNFLYTLFSSFDVCFIGFGLKDQFFMDQLERINNSIHKRALRWEKRGLRLDEKNRFAILPADNINDSEDSLKDDDGKLNTSEVQVNKLTEKYQIKVVKYDRMTETHRELEALIRKIRKMTSKEPLPDVPPITDFRVEEENYE